MHIEFTLTGLLWAIAVALCMIFWAGYRLVKRFSRRCECGHWFRVERIKIMEPDPNSFDDEIFGKKYFVYILGLCPCGMIHVYKIYSRRFTPTELWWRMTFHSEEFDRPDAHELLEKAGIDMPSHPENPEHVGHKPNLAVVVASDVTFTPRFIRHDIKPSRKVVRFPGSKIVGEQKDKNVQN